MKENIYNWQPLSVEEMYALFSNTSIDWFIAGGWALDLHVNKQTRNHSDIDICLYREDQNLLFQQLSKDWLFYKAQKGKLIHWAEGEFLQKTKDVWVRKDHHSPWAFQIMLIDMEKGDWVYGREPSIRRAKDDIYLHTSSGIPYLKPEIQLLYKGGSSQVREKDKTDFQMMLPYLTLEEKDWLRKALVRQFSNGHSWLRYLHH